MKTLIYIVLLSWISLRAQEITLPIIKQGQWILLNSGKEIVLPRDYTFVNFFDSKGHAYFQKGQRFGVINESGKEVISGKYRDIVQYENGFYLGKTDSVYHFFNIESDKMNTMICSSISILDENWLFIEEKHKSTVFNISNHLKIEIDSNTNYNVFFNHFLLEKDSLTKVLYNNLGEKLVEGNLNIEINNSYCNVSAPNFKYTFDRFGFWKFDPEASFIQMNEEFIHYKLKNKAYLLNRMDKKEIISFPCDKITKVKNVYQIEINEKMGLLSADKKILIDAKFDDIILGETFINTYFNTLKGIYSYSYKELLPCKYKTINFDENFFYTFSLNGFAGLYSRITNKEILEALYDNIEIKNRVVKAKYNGTLSIVELDEKHQEKSRLVLGPTITIKTFSPTRSNISIKYDPRLLDIGWYYDTTNYLKNGLKWGLKTGTDSVILRPKYKNITYIPQANFTLISENLTVNENKILYDRFNIQTESKKILLDHSNAKKLKTNILFHLDTTDFTNKDFCRFRDSIGFGIINRENEVKRLDYIDLGENEFVRYCYAKSKEFTEIATSISVPYQDFNILNWKQFPTKLNVQYSEAKWNFLKANGDSLFKQNFDFVQNFYLKTAIVRQDNHWGVVNSDSLVIPAKYGAIERMKIYHDTVFLVAVHHKKDIYLDSTLKIIPNFRLNFEKKHGQFSLFSQKNKYSVFNKEGKIILETEKTIKFHKFNRLVIKEKKDFLIHDENGQVIGSVKIKPEEFIDEENFMVEVNTNKGVVSIFGDTLIPIKFREIQLFPTYILCKNAEGLKLYNTDFKLIAEESSDKILVDAPSGYYAIVNEKQAQIFNDKGQRISKFKTEGSNFSLFYNKHLISEAQKLVSDSMGKLLVFNQKMMDFQTLDNHYFAIQFLDKTWEIRDQNWKKIADEIPGIRKIKYLGDHVFGLRTRNGFVIYDAISHFSTYQYKNATANWEEGFLLVEKNASKFPFEFLDRSFENPFYRSFKNAHIFENGFACVSDERGWTIIDKHSFQKSYPNFSPIENISVNLFKSKEKTTHGIIDSQGRILIEPIYEKLIPLNKSIIQGIKEGQLYYFDFAGKIIYQ